MVIDNTIEQKFFSRLGQMSATTDRLLLGVSGGVDSMTLLHLMVKSGIYFEVAHCNYQLRGKDSDADAALVKEVCEQLNVLCHTSVYDTEQKMLETRESLQNCARLLRYALFEQLCNERHLDKVVIAHNSGDTVETFFINMLRGTGLKGMTGIPQMRDNIIRPLMGCSRDEIVAYAQSNDIKWRDDITNSGNKYLRNKIRHLVIPELKKIEPQFEEVMLQNFERVGDASRFVTSMIGMIKEKATSVYRGQITIALGVVSQYEPFDFVLYEILSPMGFTHSDCTDIIDCYSKGEGTRYFNNLMYRASLSRGLLILSKTLQLDDLRHEADIYDIEQPCVMRDMTLEFELMEVGSTVGFPESKAIAMLDADKIKLPLIVRHWQLGDTFVPLGMHGRKKLSDYFIDTKVNIVDKEQQLLLCNADKEIIWVIGRRIDERFKVTAKTSNMLKITAIIDK